MFVIRYRRPGCLSIEGERADPSGIMTYSEADPEADMQNIFFLTQARFINPKCYPKRVLVSGKLICDKTAVSTILHFGLYMQALPFSYAHVNKFFPLKKINTDHNHIVALKRVGIAAASVYTKTKHTTKGKILHVCPKGKLVLSLQERNVHLTWQKKSINKVFRVQNI